MDRNKFVAMTARMDQERSKVENFGKKVLVSEMELIVLATLSRIGQFSMFMSLKGKDGEDAGNRLERQLEVVREVMGNDKGSGFNFLMQSATAMLEGERFKKYIIE